MRYVSELQACNDYYLPILANDTMGECIVVSFWEHDAVIAHDIIARIALTAIETAIT